MITMKKIKKTKSTHPPKGNLKISNFFKKTSVTSKPVNAVTLTSAQGSSNSDFSGVENIKNSNLKKPVLMVDSSPDSENDFSTERVVSKSLPLKRKLKISPSKENSKVIKRDSLFDLYKNSTEMTNLNMPKKQHNIRSPEEQTSVTNVTNVTKNEDEMDEINLQLNTVHENNTDMNIMPDKKGMSEIQEEILAKLCTPDKTSSVIMTSPIPGPLNESHCNILTPNKKVSPTPTKRPGSSGKSKLFEKSPSNLDKFNVDIINNFVKIVPNKSNVNIQRTPQKRSIEKKQSSILKYMSPSQSSIALEAQQNNERTPTKDALRSQIHSSPQSRVKAKLDFSCCSSVIPTTEKICIKKEQVEIQNDLLDIDIHHMNDIFNETWNEAFDQTDENTLDLSESQCCKITEVIRTKKRVAIKLESINSKRKARCSLEGFWIYTKLKVRDIVHIKAVSTCDGQWVVNDAEGLLVFEPDFLISTTCVVNSLFCKRRCVLSEFYQGFEPGNKYMLIGNLVHELLQDVLRNNIKEYSGVKTLVEKMLKSQSVLLQLYNIEMSQADLESELVQFIPRVVDFMHQYVFQKDFNDRDIKTNEEIWKGRIETVEDIEENIWCTNLGIKGKVDVSVKCNKKIMPLELKTGKASMSLEHKAQIILYVMMMNKLGHKISSGLLLYLREGLLTEIQIKPHESRDIIMLRNELAYFLAKKRGIALEIHEIEEEKENCKNKNYHLPDLPEPINHPACAKCPYNVICVSYLQHENYDIVDNKHLQAIQNNNLKHLGKQHIEYFLHWSSMLFIEGSFMELESSSARDIYTIPVEEREKRGRCISNVIISETDQKDDSSIEYTFKKLNNIKENINFMSSEITLGNYIVISTQSRPAVASGLVTIITNDSVTINTGNILNKKYLKSLFHLDTYESSFMTNFNLTSLTLLLEDDPQSEKLRKLIVDKAKPSFLPKLPKIIATMSLGILNRLNKVQQKVIFKSLSAEDYFLIKGLPGTGKTATIIALIQLAVAINKTVLVTSHTHSAIDNVCLRLKKFGVKILRLGSVQRVDKELKLQTEHFSTQQCTSLKEIEEVYNNAQVVAVTCAGSGHPLLSKRSFDICIVDESTQVLQTSVLRALHCAKSFILIGDPDQLRPIVRNEISRCKGMSESLFERLYNPENSMSLNLNYRMNKPITALANILTYNGELLIANESVANACLTIPKEVYLKETYKNETWLLKALDTTLDCAVKVIDTGPVWNISDPTHHLKGKCVNKYEASVVKKLVEVLLETGVSKCSVGVIATFRDQVNYLSSLLNGIDVSTVDQFQGRDKSVIFYSCTKSKNISKENPVGEFEILDDKRRLNVAITRAKHKLIIIGDVSTVINYSIFCKLLGSLSKNVIKLEDENEGFSWKYLLEGL